MSHELLGLVLLGLLFVVILGGFPISFTLFFLGMVFGYIGLGERVFYLITYQVFGTMMDTVLAAVAMFTFMGYVLESAGLIKRLFHAVQLMCGRMHGSLYFATIFTATLFAAATGIVGASVTIIALMAAPVMLKARYDVKLSAGTICAGGTLGISFHRASCSSSWGRCFRSPSRDSMPARCCPACCLPGSTSSTRWCGCG